MNDQFIILKGNGARLKTVLTVVVTALVWGLAPQLSSSATPGTRAIAQESSPQLVNPLPQSSPTLVSQTTRIPIANSQGTQVILNGRAFSVSWTQWQAQNGTRIGISDMGLSRTLGVQLLNTDSAAIQPVYWFNPASQTSLNLATRRTNTLRYLDVTDLARQLGWQVSAIGATLQITTPAAQVVGVRQGKQPWGDRLVIELNQPTPWQISQSPQELVLSLDAQSSPSLTQPITISAGKFLQSVQVEPGVNQTRLRFRLSSPTGVRVWSLANPNRIVVDLRPDSLVEQNILWSSGLRWRQQLFTLRTQQIPVFWLEMNPKQPGLTLQPILPNPTMMMGTAPLVQTAQQSQATGAINGGFFNRNRQLPLGAIRQNTRWLSGPILNRGAISWSTPSNLLFGRLTLQESVTTSTNQRFSITHLNSGYLQAGIARYTPDWGSTYTTLSDNEIIVFVQNNQVLQQQVVEKVGTGTVPIPANGYILVLRSNQSAASAFAPGTRLQVTSSTLPADFNRYPNVIAAGPLLIQNGQIVVDPKAEGFSNAFVIERASRSAIAQKADGTILIVATHSLPDGVGLTLTEVAQLLQQMGAVNALNLDGGSSTGLYLGGQLLDRLPGSAARVHNGIGVFLNGAP